MLKDKRIEYLSLRVIKQRSFFNDNFKFLLLLLQVIHSVMKN